MHNIGVFMVGRSRIWFADIGRWSSIVISMASAWLDVVQIYTMSLLAACLGFIVARVIRVPSF